MGIARTNSDHVLAWYSDGAYSEGTSANLTQYSGGRKVFTPGLKPNGQQFSMSQLIEADQSDNGKWYFYWQDGNTVFRTTSSTAKSGGSGATAVTTRCGSTPCVAPNPMAIVGIMFGSGSPARIHTYYADFWKSSSTNSLDLAQ
jgi:hypothetical protein